MRDMSLRRITVLALLTAAVLAAAILMLRLQGADEDGGPGRPGESGVAEPGLEAPGETPGLAAASGTEGPTVERSARRILRVRLTGLGSEDAASARVVVTPVYRHGRRAVPTVGLNASSDGSFEIDIGLLFAGGRPPLELSVRANHPDYVETTRRVMVEEAEPVNGVGTYRVEIPMRRAGFALFIGDSPDTVYDMDLDGEDGVFRVAGIDPGRYRLVARPGGGWKDARGHWLDEVTEVVITAGARAAVTLELRPAGRLRIHVLGPDGEPMRARCAIRDAAGARVAVWFRAQVGGGSHSSRRSIVGGLPNDVEPALQPGRYEVELSRENHETRVLMVDVEAGKTTEIEEQLLAR